MAICGAYFHTKVHAGMLQTPSVYLLHMLESMLALLTCLLPYTSLAHGLLSPLVRISPYKRAISAMYVLGPLFVFLSCLPPPMAKYSVKASTFSLLLSLCFGLFPDVSGCSLHIYN